MSYIIEAMKDPSEPRRSYWFNGSSWTRNRGSAREYSQVKAQRKVRDMQGAGIIAGMRVK